MYIYIYTYAHRNDAKTNTKYQILSTAVWSLRLSTTPSITVKPAIDSTDGRGYSAAKQRSIAEQSIVEQSIAEQPEALLFETKVANYARLALQYLLLLHHLD